MNDYHQDLRDLITRVVTGDGHQMENLYMSDTEWEAAAEERSPGEHCVTITIPVEDWLEMVHVSQNNTDTYPDSEGD